MSVIYNTSKPKSILKKKNNAVCCHTLHESVAMGESLMVHIDGNENPTDLLMKVLCSGKRKYLVNNILHNALHTNHTATLPIHVLYNNAPLGGPSFINMTYFANSGDQNYYAPNSSHFQICIHQTNPCVFMAMAHHYRFHQGSLPI